MVEEKPAVASKPTRQATGQSGSAPGQGPFMKISLAVEEGTIREVAFETYQCPGCVACGKAICELVAEKRIEAARSLRHADIVTRVGPLPRHRQICYGLALLALQDALCKL